MSTRTQVAANVSSGILNSFKTSLLTKQELSSRAMPSLIPDLIVFSDMQFDEQANLEEYDNKQNTNRLE
jgi:hypothetical protein